MNKIEKIVYDILKKNPGLKLAVRNVYQGVFDMLPREREIVPEGMMTFERYFLGFHDIQPFSKDNSMLLAHYVDDPLKLPRNGETLEVGFIFLGDGSNTYHHLASTHAWNFHKGARLQWAGAGIVYNDREGERPFAVRLDLVDGSRRCFCAPIDTVSADGRFATTFSYERLERLMPGYGYIGVRDDAEDDETGLSLLDLEDNNVRLLIPISELKAEAGLRYAEYEHFVTHTEFSKEGRYISFLHRYVHLSDISRRVTRLGIYDRESGKHFFLRPETMVSHYVWNSRNQIVAYCGLNGVDSHVLFTIEDGRCVEERPQARERLNSDGHQTFVSDDVFITDTYPDRRRMAKLYKVEVRSGKTEMLASIYSPKRYQTRDQRNHIACDLHPRASADGKWLCFDSPRSGVRSLCVVPLRRKREISVIIPSYKPGEYLWQCLETVANQTLDKQRYEVIIVINGCNEPYRTKIEQYIDAMMVGCEVTLIQTDTPGAGNARNMGLDRAIGEYVAFVDDDDYLSPSYLEELLQHAAPDTISLSNTVAFSDENDHLPFRIEREFIRCHEAGRQPYTRPKKYISGPCMKLIPMAIIGDRRFDTTLRNGEDSLFSFTISDRMRYADFTSEKAIYYRRVRCGGAQFSVTRWSQFRNAIRLTVRYTKIYFSSPKRYSLRFYISRILGCVHVIIKGPKGI